MDKIVKIFISFFVVVLFSLTAGTVYYNGSLNGIQTPELLSAMPSRQNGILLEWVCKDQPVKNENNGFAVYRSVNGSDYAFIGSTRFYTYLDADNLQPGREYTYKIASFSYNYYGDGEYVFSDYSNEISSLCCVSEKADDEFSSFDGMSEYLAGKIKKLEQEIRIHYTGEWVTSLWEDVYLHAFNSDEELKWLYYSYFGSSEYSGCVNGTNTYTLIYKFEYYSSAAENNLLKSKLPGIIEFIGEKYGCSEKSSDYKKAKAIYCYITESISFDSTKRMAGGKLRERFSAYDALVNNRASSQGMSLAFMLLARETGLDAAIIHGDGYCWNLVGIDGEWYNIDVCESVRSSFLTFEFFLFQDSQCKYTKDEYYAEGSEFYNLHPPGGKIFAKESGIPKDIKCVSSNGQVSISFANQDDKIWIYVSSDGEKFSFLAAAEGGVYTHKNLKNGRSYYYKAVSYNLDQEGEKLFSDYSATVKATPNSPVFSLDTPKIVDIEQISEKLLKVSFSEVKGALGYEICLSSGNEYEAISESSGLYCILEPGKESGVLSIRAINGKIKSELSEGKQFFLIEKTIEIESISALDGNTVLLEFEEGVSVCVFRSESIDGEYSRIGVSDSGAYTDKDVGEGKTYFYRAAVVNDAFIGVNSQAKSITALSPPAVFSLSQTSEGILLEWEPHQKADIYSIYRSDSLDGEYICIFTERHKLFYIDKNIEKGRMYFYKICCSSYAGGNEYYTSPFCEASGILYLDKPDILSAVRNREGSTLALAWKEVQFADGYKINRRDTIGGEAVEFFCEGKISFTDTDISPAKSYYYSVTPYRKSGSLKFFGPDGDISISFRTLPAYITDSQTQTTLEWTNIMEADGYILSRSVGNAPFNVFIIADSTSCLLDRTSANVNIQYKIYPYIDIGSKRIFGNEVYFTQRGENEMPLTDDEKDISASTSDLNEHPSSPKDNDQLRNTLVNIFLPLLSVLVIIIAVYNIKKHWGYIKM